jgi:hypothetical protein
LNRAVILWLACPAFCCPALLNFVPASFPPVSPPEHKEGVAVSSVSWMEPGVKVGATVFVPDGDPLPGIVFSRSAIHGPTASADMLHLHGHLQEREQQQS